MGCLVSTGGIQVGFIGFNNYYDEITYSENEIRRIAKRGFDIAMKRRKKVTSVDIESVQNAPEIKGLLS